MRIGLRPRLVTLQAMLDRAIDVLRIGLRPRLVTLGQPSPTAKESCGLVSGQDWLHSVPTGSLALTCCGLVSGQDWLHWPLDWLASVAVADWSQAKIGYTRKRVRKPAVQLRIGLRPRLVTLLAVDGDPSRRLRIGLRPRLVTLRRG